MKNIAVVLAGGNGTRFWPLSRRNNPKQMLNLSGKNIMINETFERLDGFIKPEDYYVVTAENQKDIMCNLLMNSIDRNNILYEPVAKNTAPSILFASLFLKSKYNDAVMCVFPSDQHIKKTEEFLEVLKKATIFAEKNDDIVTIGIKPTFASTGYGYIKSGEKADDYFYHVDSFCEKPDCDTALKYLESGKYLWNSGIFVFRISVILNAFQRHLPDMYASLYEWYDKYNCNFNSLKSIFPRLLKISIDYGILERSDNVSVIEGDFGWSDVGSFDSLNTVVEPDSNGNIVLKTKNLLLDTNNCVIFGNNKLVTTIGVDDLIIVNTDDATLVCKKNKAQNIRNIVEKLEENSMHEYL